MFVEMSYRGGGGAIVNLPRANEDEGSRGDHKHSLALREIRAKRFRKPIPLYRPHESTILPVCLGTISPVSIANRGVLKTGMGGDH